MKKVSVIVAAYNAADTIERCMDSLLRQTLRKKEPDALEIIAADDCSADDTFDILKDYEKRYPGTVCAIRTPENLRQGGARTMAFRHAKAPYVGYCDADDWTESVMYEHMYEKAVRYDADVVFCRHVRDSGLRVLDPQNIKTGSDDVFVKITSHEDREKLIASNYLGKGLWDHLFKRDFIAGNNIYQPSHLAYEDIFSGTLVNIYAKSFYILEERLYHYYVNPDSTVLSLDKPYHNDFFKVHETLWAEYEKRGLLDELNDVLCFEFLMSGYIAGLKLLALRYSSPEYELYEYLFEKTANILKNADEKRLKGFVDKYCDEFQRMQTELIYQKPGREEILQLYGITRGYYT